MATDPLGGGPLDPNAPQGVPNQSKATGVPSMPNMGPLQDTLNTMAEASLRMSETLERVMDRLEAMARAASTVSDNLKDGVNQAEDLTGNIRESINAQKDFNNNISGQKRSYGEILAHMQRVAQTNKQMLESTRGNANATKSLQANIKALEKIYEDASREAKKFGTNTAAADNAMKSYAQTLAGVTRNQSALAAEQGKMASSRLEAHVKALNREYRDAGMQVKVLERAEALYARNNALRNIQALRAAHKEGKREDIREQFARAGGPAAAILGQDFIRKKKGGGVDWQAMKARQPDLKAYQAAQGIDYGKMAEEKAYRGGKGVLGGIDKYLSEKAYRAQAMAKTGVEQPGMLGKAGVALSEAGGGSVLAGAAEGGMGAMGAMAGPAAAIYAIGKTIQKGWDTYADTNAAIEKSLGGALFTPNMTGGQALRMVRDNLSANGFNAYGQNLDRNLAIAKAMQEAGLDVTEISRQDLRTQGLPSGRAVDRGAGFLGGGFGEFQQNAMVAGRNIGLTDTQTVVRMTKMLQEMRQTFEATHDFLESVNTSARAAGISTTKYLSIVDDLTAQFDKMNKSFQESVNIINALGASGTVTADNISDMAKALTGAGEQKTVEQNAAAFAFMDQPTKDALVATQQTVIDQSVDHLQKALDTAHVNKGDLKLTDAGDLMKLQAKIAQMPNSLEKQNLQSASDAARYSIEQMNAVIKPGTAGNVAQATYGIQTYGQGAAVKAANQISLLKEGLKAGGQSMADVMAHPDTINAISSAAAAALGYKPEDLQKAVEALNTIGAGGTQRIKDMETGPARDKELQHFWDIGKRTRMPNGKPMFSGAFDKSTMEAALDSSEMSEALNRTYSQDLAKNPDLALSVLTEQQAKADEAKQDEQVKDVAMQTRNSADIFANAFEYLFRMLVDTISKITDILSWKMKWTGGSNTSTETQATLDNFKARGMMNIAEKEMRERAASSGPDASYATRALTMKQTYEAEDKHTEEQSLAYQKSIEAYAATGAMGSMGAKLTDEQWKTLKQEPGISQQALEEQAIRGVMASAPGGHFGNYDKEGGSRTFALGSLTEAQKTAIDAILVHVGLKRSEENGQQVIHTTTTLNSTDIQVLLNRHGSDALRAPNKSGEVTDTGGAQAKPMTTAPGPASRRIGQAPGASGSW